MTSAPETIKTNTPCCQSKAATKITIKYDAGFGNILTIRGQGANLNWSEGVQLKNVNPDEWTWETEQPFTSCEFKVLLNDHTYEQGHNHQLTKGSHLQYTPKF